MHSRRTLSMAHVLTGESFRPRQNSLKFNFGAAGMSSHQRLQDAILTLINATSLGGRCNMNRDGLYYIKLMSISTCYMIYNHTPLRILAFLQRPCPNREHNIETRWAMQIRPYRNRVGPYTLIDHLSIGSRQFVSRFGTPRYSRKRYGPPGVSIAFGLGSWRGRG